MGFKIFLLLFCMELIGLSICILGLYIKWKKELNDDEELINIINKYKLEDN